MPLKQPHILIVWCTFTLVLSSLLVSSSWADDTYPHRYYFPVIAISPPPPPPPAVQPLPPPAIYSSFGPVNFQAARANLAAQGLDIAYNKIGFHVGSGGSQTGLGDWMRDLDAAGVPFFLKSADHAGAIFEAQELMKRSGVPHTLVFRRTGREFDVPNYDLPPAEAARIHWERHLSTFPPELDKRYVWLETVNEVDKNRTDWLAEFAIETAKLALRDGYKWAAFGWSSGEPEPFHWESPRMLAFLRLVAQYPDQLAIGLHEYSYTKQAVGNMYPYLIGRFQHLFQICDDNNIPRPTVFITEWGWEYQNIPIPEQAMEDIRWAAWLYAAYPQVKGAALWYLGGYFGTIDQQAQKLIMPLRDYSLTHYFGVTPGQGSIKTELFTPQTDPRIGPDQWPDKRPISLSTPQ